MWLSFFGIWLADGSVRGSLNNFRTDKQIRYGINIKQKNIKNVNKIKNIFDQLPFKYNQRIGKNGVTEFSIIDRQLWEYIKQFGNSHTKFIPKYINCLSANLIKIFLSFYLMGDGTKLRKNIKYRRKNKTNDEIGKYCNVRSHSKQLKIDLLELFIKIGVCSRIIDNYVVFPNVASVFLGLHKQQQYYKGKIYTLKVEKSNIIFIKRNEKTCFCGT